MNLSKRLLSIYNLVPQDDVVIDVGADHGQLIISLIENNVCGYGYAVENKKGPYERLVKAISASKVKDKIKPIFSSGIHDMPKDAKTVIIAGMGGQTIVDILKDDKDKLDSVKTILVDSHGVLFLVRNEINKLGFAIDKEVILKEDGIYYEIIRFVKGDISYDDDDLEYGPILRREKGPVFIEKWNTRLDEIENLLMNDRVPQSRKVELQREKERIVKVL